jgi:hypothetical protein
VLVDDVPHEQPEQGEDERGGGCTEEAHQTM